MIITHLGWQRQHSIVGTGILLGLPLLINIVLGLLRFIPKSHSSEILLGQPIDDEVDVGIATREGQEVLVAVYSGNSVLEPGFRTSRIEAVSTLLSPLAQEEVGTIRCIGLNVYAKSLETPRAMAEYM